MNDGEQRARSPAGSEGAGVSSGSRLSVRCSSLIGVFIHKDGVSKQAAQSRRGSSPALEVTVFAEVFGKVEIERQQIGQLFQWMMPTRPARRHGEPQLSVVATEATA